MAPNTHAATNLLGQLLGGLALVSRSDELSFSLDDLHDEAGVLWTKVILPTGDTYRVSVEWLSEESP